MMTIRGTVIFLSSLAVLSSTAQDESTSPSSTELNCSSHTDLEHLSTQLQVAVECGDALLRGLNGSQAAVLTAVLLSSMRTLSDTLHKHHLAECPDAEPQRCPMPEVPSDGGLACVTVSGKRYCKHMCNEGYDFAFLRQSRLYEECSEDRGYRWTSQYIVGNKLAICLKSSMQISGAETAYFPKGQDCLRTKSHSDLQKSIFDTFTTELTERGKDGELKYSHLVCG